MKLADLDMDKTYSYADYLKWKIAERVELIKGKIFEMSPAPTSNHQLVSGHISNKLMNFLEGNTCMVFTAPFDVRLATKKQKNNDIYTVVQPDICVIGDISKVDKKGCIGAPDIVVEILSSSNNKKELKNKYEVYEQAGVKEYWIVSPQNQSVIIYTLVDGHFVPSKLMAEGDVAYSSALPGFSLDIAGLFKRLL